MLRPLRSIISLALLAGALWAAFAVDLGGRSFAEHIDTISQTPEAEELIEGTRATINPALAEVRDRLLGEYVEAPTWISAEDADLAPARALAPASEREAMVPASAAPEAAAHEAGAEEPALPGRRAAAQPGPDPAPDYEPALPGRRR